MAYIKSIILHNFYNYYGENNKYEFKDNMNIVIADNNGGKSKLYNAFLLILSDQVIDSDNREKTNLESPKIKFKILSDKAKIDAQVEDEIKCGVELVFETSIYEITINKIFFGKKLNDNIPYEIANWRISDLKTNITKKEKSGAKSIDVPKSEHNRIIDMLLPSQLSHYCMFQGEEVAELVNRGLTNAISKLTDLNKFQYFGRFISDIHKKSVSIFEREETKLANNKSKAELLNNEIKNINEIIETIEKDLDEFSSQKNDIDLKLEELGRKISEAQEQHEIYKKIGINSEKLDRNVDEQEQFEREYNNHFFSNKWILKGLYNYKNEFDKLRSEYEDEISKKKIKKFTTPLPQDSPDISSLDKMLRIQKCLVCGREAKKDTIEYEHIEKLKKYHEIGKEKKSVTAIKIFLDTLFKASDNFITDDFIIKTKESLNIKIEKMKLENEKLSIEKEDLISKMKSNKDHNIKIINDHREQMRLKSILEKRISDYNYKMKETSKKLEIKKKQLDSLVEDKSTLLPLENKVQILKDLKTIFLKTRNRFYYEESKKFEKSINNFYKSLTKGNETNPGKVEITVDDRFNFYKEIKNPEGGLLSGQGAAFQRMQQLAIVMGLMKENLRTSTFPLIADAPISEMGEILTQNFFYNVPKVFKQSIIFIKDFCDRSGKINDLGKNIINDTSIRVYMNKAIGSDQQERETKIKLIKD